MWTEHALNLTFKMYVFGWYVFFMSKSLMKLFLNFCESLSIMTISKVDMRNSQFSTVCVSARTFPESSVDTPVLKFKSFTIIIVTY